MKSLLTPLMTRQELNTELLKHWSLYEAFIDDKEVQFEVMFSEFCSCKSILTLWKCGYLASLIRIILLSFVNFLRSWRKSVIGLSDYFRPLPEMNNTAIRKARHIRRPLFSRLADFICQHPTPTIKKQYLRLHMALSLTVPPLVD